MSLSLGIEHDSFITQPVSHPSAALESSLSLCIHPVCGRDGGGAAPNQWCDFKALPPRIMCPVCAQCAAIRERERICGPLPPTTVQIGYRD